METRTAFTRMMEAPLAERTDSYTPISHSHIDESTKRILTEMGFHTSQIIYRSSMDGLVGQGEYHLQYGGDKEMGLMVAWQNSYNKAVSFKYAVGAHVFICANGMVSGDLGAYRRKHTGDADLDAGNHMKKYLYGAKQIFDRLVEDREFLKDMKLSRKDAAQLIGRMFIEKELITSTQLNIIKRELDKPTHDYSTDPNSAWALYNHATYAFKEDNPKNWMKRHVDLHEFFTDCFALPPVEEIQYEQPQLFTVDPEEEDDLVTETEEVLPAGNHPQEPSEDLLDMF